ncbi:hypothetical protein ACOMHN_008972 [Nucella lapillus]
MAAAEEMTLQSVGAAEEMTLQSVGAAEEMTLQSVGAAVGCSLSVLQSVSAEVCQCCSLSVCALPASSLVLDFSSMVVHRAS